MPDSLKFEADQRFFEHALDGVDVVVHGRHSQERQQRSHLRHRLMLTRRVPAIAPHPSNAMALLWNPAGASFEEALLALGNPGAVVGVIGGPDVFALFLDRYDSFHLSRAPDVRLPGGRPVFPEVPVRTPEQVLAAHGLAPDPPPGPGSSGRPHDGELATPVEAQHRLSMTSARRPAQCHIFARM